MRHKTTVGKAAGHGEWHQIRLRLPREAAPAEGRPERADTPMNPSREAPLAARPLHSPREPQEALRSRAWPSRGTPMAAQDPARRNRPDDRRPGCERPATVHRRYVGYAPIAAEGLLAG